MIKEYYTRTLSDKSYDPVSLTEAKAHLRVEHTDDDTYITALIAAALDIAENYIDADIRKYTTQVYLSDWPNLYLFKRLPFLQLDNVITVADGINHYDNSENEVTVDVGRGYASLKFNETYTTDDDADFEHPYLIEATTGYTNAASVPQAIKHALLMIIGHLYENREDVSEMSLKEIPQGSKYLLFPYKTFAV